MLTEKRPRAELLDLDENALVALAREGGENAVRVLIQRNNQRLFRIARSILRNDADAEDVVQESYVRAFTRLDSFLGHSSFSTWLTRIALNEAFGRVRRRRNNTELIELDAAVTSDPGLASLFPLSLVPPAADTETDRTAMRRVLEEAIDGLPEAFRIVFILRDVEGLNTEEVAAQLSLKEETVKTRLHRARRVLRKSIEERMAGSFAEIYPFDGARCVDMADRVIARLKG